jgi:hypothetical protein
MRLKYLGTMTVLYNDFGRAHDSPLLAHIRPHIAILLP